MPVDSAGGVESEAVACISFLNGERRVVTGRV